MIYLTSIRHGERIKQSESLTPESIHQAGNLIKRIETITCKPSVAHSSRIERGINTLSAMGYLESSIPFLSYSPDPKEVVPWGETFGKLQKSYDENEKVRDFANDLATTYKITLQKTKD